MSCGKRYAGLLSCLLLAACASTAPTRDAATPEPATADDAPAPPAEPAPQTATRPSPSTASKPETPPHGLQRLAADLGDPECQTGRVVNRWISRYQEQPQRWHNLWRGGLPLLYWVRARIAEAGLPAEFALIPMVESHFRPEARNGSNVGMWQLSSITARDLGLSTDTNRDERLDPIPATETAIILLQRLMDRFGDWRLAAMAYNAGEYRVARALNGMPDDAQPSAAEHQPPGLANTTYEYMAKLEALSCLIAEPARFGLTLPEDDAGRLEVVEVPDVFRSLARLSSLTGIDADRAGRLNPASRRYRIDQRHRRLLLPGSDAARLRAWSSALATGAIAPVKPEEAVTHVVAPGDSLWTIARRHRLSTREIQRWNALPDGAVLHPGQILRLEP